MSRQYLSRYSLVGSLVLLMLMMSLTACGGTQPASPTSRGTEATPPTKEQPSVASPEATTGAAPTGSTQTVGNTKSMTEPISVGGEATSAPEPTEKEPPPGSFQTPHPILSDLRVRQAIAYCTNREELVQSVYPFLDDTQRKNLLMDTFIPKGHWAHSDAGIVKYPFDPGKGKQLLEEAGWKQTSEGKPRKNDKGNELSIGYTTTDASFRVTYSTVLERQLLENCGIQIVRNHVPGSWWFGNATGLQRRDFELGAYAWVGQADPAGVSLYTCNQIPLPKNNWEGQNYMGWCNQIASNAIVAANNTLDRAKRKENYAIAQQEFTKDMVSLPLFNRFEAAAASNNLMNFKPDVSESSYVVNIHEWELKDGGDTVILAFTQEPATLSALLESASVVQITGDLLSVRAATGRGYDYQPVALKELSTIENGRAEIQEVEVKEGDVVWGTKGEPITLTNGVEVINAEGKFVTYEGGSLKLPQLTVHHEIVDGLKWEDGQPVKKEDIELANKINCSPDIEGISLTVCRSIQEFTVTSDTAFSFTYLPGAVWPEYMVYTPGTYAGTSFTVGAYPAHQTLSDGRKLADVSAKEWSTLPEIAEKPLSYGPYKLVEWKKGQRMVFEANPYYVFGEPKIKKVIIQFFDDTNAAVAQLLTGDVDVVGTETLGAGAELESTIKAGEEGKVQVFPLASSTWEHVDMNLFEK